MIPEFAIKHSWGLTFEVVNDQNLIVFAGSFVQCTCYVCLRELGYDTIDAERICNKKR